MPKDYYKILGLELSAKKVEIKKAYLKLARKYHPDINPIEPKSGEKFIELNRAYVILYDEKRREMYNTLRDVEQNPSAYQNKSGEPISKRTWSYKASEFSAKSKDYIELEQVPHERYDSSKGVSKEDLFKDVENVIDISSSGTSLSESSFPTDGDDLKHNLNISFIDSYNGGKRQFKFADPISGDEKSLIINFSKGIRDGDILRLEGKGIPGISGGVNGDLYVIIHVNSHSKYKRKADDIYLTKEIPFTTAMLGGKISVQFMDKKLNANVPANTKDSSILRLKGPGFYNENTKQQGDLLVKIKIQVPERTNKFQKETLLKLRVLGL